MRRGQITGMTLQNANSTDWLTLNQTEPGYYEYTYHPPLSSGQDPLRLGVRAAESAAAAEEFGWSLYDLLARSTEAPTNE